MLTITVLMCQYVGFKICNYLRVLCTRFHFQQHTTRVHECGGCCSNGNSMPTRLLSLPSPTHSSLSLSLSSCRQQVQILARKCAARWRKKKFSTHPRRISHCLAISVIISREKQNVLQVASWMLLSACCLLHVAGCPLPVARCLLPGGSVDPGLANYAPRAKW